VTKTTDEKLLAIGTVADRTGVAVSAIRFYEEEGLIFAVRSPAGHRMFARSTIRRVSFIRICQGLGYRLDEVAEQLNRLPEGRTPTEADWQELAAGFRHDIDQRITALENLKDRLDGCIGCGCLSLKTCAIYNPSDAAHGLGAGPRYLLGNTSDDLKN
jgi:MerR family redox-sensitive transcriptional activator SoxR